MFYRFMELQPTKVQQRVSCSFVLRTCSICVPTSERNTGVHRRRIAVTCAIVWHQYMLRPRSELHWPWSLLHIPTTRWSIKIAKNSAPHCVICISCRKGCISYAVGRCMNYPVWMVECKIHRIKTTNWRACWMHNMLLTQIGLETWRWCTMLSACRQRWCCGWFCPSDRIRVITARRGILLECCTAMIGRRWAPQ